jgi:hypothetical protein
MGLGSIIAVTASLACSWWFFYSIQGEGGATAVIWGFAGSSIQLFGYGFAAKYVKAHWVEKVALCVAPLALSMFTTYSTIYGFLASKAQEEELTDRKNQLVFEMLEQSKKDKQLISSAVSQAIEMETMKSIALKDMLKQSQEDRALANQAASQAINNTYRDQSKEFFKLNRDSLRQDQELIQSAKVEAGKELFELNQKAREKDEILLSRIDSEINGKTQVTPLNGLVQVVGSSELAITIFCAWLALLFDLLPVRAIAALTRGHNETRAELPREIESHREQVSVPMETPFAPEVVKKNAFETLNVEVPTNEPQTIQASVDDDEQHTARHTTGTCAVRPSNPRAKYENADRGTCSTGSDVENKVVEVCEEEILSEMRHGKLDPSYKEVRERTGWKQWKTQMFFQKCQEDGFIEKQGRGFVLVNNVEPLKKTVNA